MTTFNGGSLGSCIDEERCELRYVMRIAQLSESSNLWTHIALGQSMLQHAWSSVVSKPHITYVCIILYMKICSINTHMCVWKRLLMRVSLNMSSLKICWIVSLKPNFVYFSSKDVLFPKRFKGATSFPCGKHLVRSKMMSSVLDLTSPSLLIVGFIKIHIKPFVHGQKESGLQTPSFFFSRTDLGSGKITRWI